eukprot:TRINITY_DN9136_c0_g2_i2.p1 TRINITY_DN9136_c0_g2~~TRINITY_DN9136_c0_g2_i2.p1  ORF type:complete len:287 (+),score=36.71 TRINITY_DN9136_c0_g2_i2:57-863(+)
MDTLTLRKTATYLRIEDMARWRTVDTTTTEALEIEDDDNIWRYCAQNEFGDKVFATYELYESPQRQLCFKFSSMLSRATVMLSSEPLFVPDLEDVSLIERRLRNAECVCSAHRSTCERDAKVLLGEFCLHEAGVGTMFQFGGEDMPSTLAGLPSGVLAIALFLQKGVLMSCAKYGVEKDGVLEEYHEAARVQLTMNVDSADSEEFMSYRGIPLILDGRWRSSKNGFYSEHVRSGSAESVLCVLSLLDGEVNAPKSSLVNAMSLEFFEK